MELTMAISLVASVVAPFVVALITRPEWSADRKRYVAIAVCAVLGVIAAVASGKIDGIPDKVEAWTAQAVVAVGVVVGLAQGFYQVLKTPVSKVEAATSPTKTLKKIG